jgi:hypothetical protein
VAGILTPVAACYGLAARGVDVLRLSLLACVGLLGAGACSLDARLFGRREIVVPRAPHERGDRR